MKYKDSRKYSRPIITLGVKSDWKVELLDVVLDTSPQAVHDLLQRFDITLNELIHKNVRRV